MLRTVALSSIFFLSLACSSARSAQQVALGGTAAAPQKHAVSCRSEVPTGSHILEKICFDGQGNQMSLEETQRYVASLKQKNDDGGSANP